MKPLNAELLQTTIESLEKQKNTARKNVDSAHDKIHEWKSKKTAAENSLTTVERGIFCLKAALVVLEGIPEEVAELREKIIKNMEKVIRKDIKVSTVEKTRTELKKQKKELKKICPHNFVITIQITHKVHRHFPDDDYWAPGIRQCAVCKLKESSGGTAKTGYMRTQDTYEVLKIDDGRVVGSRSIIENHKKLSEDTKEALLEKWLPTEEILEAFLDERVFDLIA